MPAKLRPSTVLFAAAVAFLLVTPLAAAAPAEGAEKVGAIPSVKQGLATGIVAVITFAIVAAFLGAVVWPKIQGALDERANKIRDEIASAERARQQAKDALAEYERSLAEARAEANQMLEQTKAQQAKLAAELRAKAETEAGELKARALREIESAKKEAISEIYADSAALATTIASKLIGREVSADDQQRLIDESLVELSASRN